MPDHDLPSNSGVADNRARFRPAHGEVPTVPGVYRFSDRHGRVLYIGKAKNLRSRVSNYFGPLAALNPRTQRMLALATQVDWTVVSTDTEALVLEHTWINEFAPPFNVQFRDDKSYPYFAVTLAADAPRLLITRNQNVKGARYFGPFPKVWAVRESAALLHKAFPIRTCNDADYRRAMTTGIPCLASQIGRCHGPCSHRISLEEHRDQVMKLVAFLSGHDSAELRKLRTEMKRAASEQEYELAANLRDRISAAEHILENNGIVLRESVNADVYGLFADDLACAVHQFIIRSGRIRGERSWIVDVQLNESHSDLMSALLQDAYLNAQGSSSARALADEDARQSRPPAQIIVSELPTDVELLAGILSKSRGSKVLITQPSRGEKQDIVERARVNAREHLQRHKLKRAADILTRTDGLAEIQEALQLTEVPLRIECVDISHLSGTNVVGSLVVFEDGLPAKSNYRHYRIDETSDDTDSIYQVVRRRYARLLEDTEESSEVRRNRVWPELLIVDGGQPQVAAAQRALSELGVTSVALCGVAKRLEELWIPSQDFPVIMPRSSEGLFLIQRIRDEAHRFAITFQRQKRSNAIESSLSDLPGLGEKRVRALLQRFKSLKRLSHASVEEIASIPGIGDQLAGDIHARLHTTSSP